MRRIRTVRRLLAFPGTCSVCELNGHPRTVYVERDPWSRDHLLCRRCHSVPRQRSVATVLQEVRPRWRELAIHESSPADGGISALMARQAPGYTSSQFLEGVAPGDVVGGIRCEDLSNLSFADASLDILLTQDVMEHVLTPEKVLDEIARVLRPDGIHLATFPWYPTREHTRLRAVRDEQTGEIEHLEEPDYHLNPVGDGRALVTVDWGADLFGIAARHGFALEVHKLGHDRSRGIDGEFREVFVFTGT